MLQMTQRKEEERGECDLPLRSVTYQDEGYTRYNAGHGECQTAAAFFYISVYYVKCYVLNHHVLLNVLCACVCTRG